MTPAAVADPGFGAWTLTTVGAVEVKVILSVFWP